MIIKPVVTEKSMQDVAKGKFTFIVDEQVSKTQIKFEIKKLFKVNPVKITTSILKGRSLKSGKKGTIKALKNTKKAVIQLKKGEKIGLFEGEK